MVKPGLRGRAFVNAMEKPGLRSRAFVNIMENPDSKGRAFVNIVRKLQPGWANLGPTWAKMSHHGPT